MIAIFRLYLIKRPKSLQLIMKVQYKTSIETWQHTVITVINISSQIITETNKLSCVTLGQKLIILNFVTLKISSILMKIHDQ